MAKKPSTNNKRSKKNMNKKELLNLSKKRKQNLQHEIIRHKQIISSYETQIKYLNATIKEIIQDE